MGEQKRFSLLIVDDEAALCESLSEYFSALGYETYTAQRVEDVRRILSRIHVDLILMDIRMPEKDGITLLRELKTSHSSTPVIMISAYVSVENIVRSMKYGAINFYEKPLDLRRLSREVAQIAAARAARAPQGPTVPLIHESAAMQDILATIEKVAPTDAPVLITGESGTGKELVAHAIHHRSERARGPFLKLNCAAIPETLLESELFGYEKGAFTGAVTQHKGKFEQAQSGTIFFDEIGDMHLGTQAKLLRVLQEKEFQRLGGSEVLYADVRIIAATHQYLPGLIEEHRFREDLYYRLSVITIHIPPLRDRRDDILPLTRYYIDYFSKLYGKRVEGLSPEVERLFLSHSWPGNVRELKNTIERAVIFTEGERLTMDDLPPQYRETVFLEPVPEGDLSTAMDHLSREIILKALEKAGGKKQKAAELLGIHRKTLYNKMKKLGLL
ncbi:sigma-54-dependent transcriptional regulator [Spirochaeta thermophila]|nr:sigma-54 dependent transcriptional regulator [Spirochaeta thermophila]